MSSKQPNSACGSSQAQTSSNSKVDLARTLGTATSIGFQYKKVLALLLCWKDEKEGLWGETDQLRNVFEKQYDFDTEIYRIPSKDPEAELSEKLQEIKEKAQDEETLVILYYSGHGGTGSDEEGRTRLTWNPFGDHDDDQLCGDCKEKCSLDLKVFWPTVEKELKEIQRDVLVIIDSCDAAAALAQTTPDGSTKRMDIIAACGHDGRALLPRLRTYENRLGTTFTEMLIHVLEEKAETKDVFNTASLHLGIMQRMLQVKKHTDRELPTPLLFSVGAINGIQSPNVPLKALGMTAATGATDEAAQKKAEEQAKLDKRRDLRIAELELRHRPCRTCDDE